MPERHNTPSSTNTQVNKHKHGLSEVFSPCPSSSRLLLLTIFSLSGILPPFVFRLDCSLSSLFIEILSIVYGPSQISFFSWVVFLDLNGIFPSITLDPPNGVIYVSIHDFGCFIIWCLVLELLMFILVPAQQHQFYKSREHGLFFLGPPVAYT